MIFNVSGVISVGRISQEDDKKSLYLTGKQLGYDTAVQFVFPPALIPAAMAGIDEGSFVNVDMQVHYTVFSGVSKAGKNFTAHNFNVTAVNAFVPSRLDVVPLK